MSTLLHQIRRRSFEHLLTSSSVLANITHCFKELFIFRSKARAYLFTVVAVSSGCVLFVSACTNLR